MKQLFTLLLIVAYSFTNAQIVNIPDSVFLRNLINAGVDTNNDGQIQQSEALAVTVLSLASPVYCYTGGGGSIECQSYPIENLTGIQSFTNLQSLSIDNEYSNSINTNRGISIIDLTGLINLTSLFIKNSPVLNSLNVRGCTALRILSLGINSYPPSDLNTNLDSLDLQNLTNLESVSCYKFAQLKSVNLKNCINLRSIYLFEPGCIPRDLHVNTLSNLERIQTDGYMTGGNSEDTLDFSNLTHLKKVWLSGVSFESSIYYFNNCTSLDSVDLEPYEGPTQSTLDFSTCPRLKYLAFGSANVAMSSNLKLLSIKNGSILDYLQISYVSPSNNILNICVDDFEVQSVRRFVSNINYTYSPLNTNIYSYCSFYPGGAYNTIQGKLRIDDNTNGCANNTGRVMQDVPIKFSDTTGQSILTYSNNLGDYAMYTYKGLFSFAPYFPYPYFTFNPTNPIVRFDTANSLVNTTNFCLQSNGIHNDLEITLMPIRFARPGFNTNYILTYKNRGTTTLSGNVNISYDNAKENYVSATQTPTTQSTGQLSWNYSNLQPFESRTINVTFNLLPPPVNNIGDTIHYLATITPVANDETQFDNSFILPQLIRGSFDPNDKQCIEGSKLAINKIGDYLHYQINFQNEGTDTAFNIVVADTLSNNYDWNSFELINTSYPCNVKLTNNKLEFFFQDIKLPYKAINEPASHGYVNFKIKPKSNLIIGDSLNNSAAIYFDFNLPVITDKATTIVSPAIVTPIKLQYFSISTNNNTNTLNWKVNANSTRATFTIERSTDAIHFTSIGTVTATQLRCQLPFNYADNNPTTGINYYRIKITDAEGVSFYSKILSTSNNITTGIGIKAVTNNAIYLSSNKQQIVQLKIITADGRTIYNSSKQLIEGNNNIPINFKTTTTGVYSLIVYTNNGEIITKKFLK